MAYRAAGLCVACAKAERRAGRIDGWEAKWRARRGAAKSSVGSWVGVLLRVVRHIPASTIERELDLEPGEVRQWKEQGDVPLQHRADLVELARRAKTWRWS